MLAFPPPPNRFHVAPEDPMGNLDSIFQSVGSGRFGGRRVGSSGRQDGGLLWEEGGYLPTRSSGAMQNQ